MNFGVYYKEWWGYLNFSQFLKFKNKDITLILNKLIIEYSNFKEVLPQRNLKNLKLNCRKIIFI